MVAVTEHLKVPELRFPEFSGEWEEKRLGDVCEKPEYGLNSSATSYNGTDAYIRITDIDQDSGKFGTKSLVSPDNTDDDSCLVNMDDILIARTGASTGKSFIYKKTFDFKLHFAGFLIRFKVISAIPSFIYSNLRTTSYERWVSVMSMRSGQPGINAKEYGSFPVALPSLPEQQKIAEFLTAVDEKIGKLKRKKELLEAYKKGAMQKLFSQEIRFKDDQGNPYPDWEEKRLGELGRFVGGGTPSKETPEYWNGEIPWISSSDVSETSIRAVNIRRFITEVARSESATHLIPPGSVLFVSRVGIGKVGINTVALCTSQDFANLIPKKDSAEFLAYYFFSEKNILIRYAQGTSIKGFTTSDLKAIKLEMPSTEEQQKIAEFLTGIDDKIKAVANQIDKAAEFKKGLLQKMFV